MSSAINLHLPRIITVTFGESEFGAQMRHKELVRALIKYGREVVWICPSERSRQEGAVNIVLEWGWACRYGPLGKILSMLRTRRKYGNLFKDRCILVAFSEYQMLALCLASMRHAVERAVLFSRGDSLQLLEFQMIYAISWLQRTIYGVKYIVQLLIERFVLNCVDLIVVQNPYLKAAVINRTGLSHEKVAVLPNSSQASWMKGKKRRIEELIPKGQDKVIVGLVSSISIDRKGLDLAVDAASFVKSTNVLFVHIGDGPDREWRRLKHAIKDKDVYDFFHCAGSVPNAADYFYGFSVFLAVSRLDFCPNTLIEAVRARVPIVATDIDAHRYLLGENYIGLCACTGEEIAKKLRCMIYDTKVRVRAIAQIEEAARRLDFDWNAWADRLVMGSIVVSAQAETK